MKIDTAFTDTVCSTIARGNRLNRLLPNGGKIVMDQPLPFLCIYRYSVKPDPNFTQLIKTQASYLIVDESVDIKELLSCVVATASAKFNSFLLLELWPDPDNESKQFKILGPADRAPATIKALQKGFHGFEDIYPSIEVKTQDIFKRHPDHLEQLLFIDEAKELGGLMIGVKVPPIYEETESGNAFFIFFRKFRAKFSDAIKKAAFEFTRVQTSNEFNHYLMLGKTRLDNLVRFADKQLAEISEKMNFLMRVTPVNDAHEWENFKKNNFEKTPSFNYRLIPLDPELEKRKLYKIRLQRIEDPTLAYIFRDKRLELEKQLTMLEERETRNFQYIGQSLYGVVGENDLQAADSLLEYVDESHDDPEVENCKSFANRAQKEIEAYKKHFPGIDLQVQIRKDVSGIMVSKSHLLISEDFKLSSKRVEALIQHEVGTHILTYCNGYQQPIKQMYAGFAGYDQLQEGLAVLSEYLVNGLTSERLRLLAGRVRAVDSMVQGAEFVETFRLLKDNYHFEPKEAYNITMRVFRGGGLTKDAVYLTGLIELLKYLQNGGDYEILNAGKFHLKHVPIIEELIHRKILKKPLMAPYLKLDKVKNRLKNLKEIKNLSELITQQTNDYSLHN